MKRPTAFYMLLGLLVVGAVVYGFSRMQSAPPEVTRTEVVSTTTPQAQNTGTSSLDQTNQVSGVETATATPHVQLPAVDISKIEGGPIVSFNFDDGLLSAYEKAIPLFNAAGYKTTQYIITGAFKKKNYVTAAQVLDMQAMGHEIGAHTRTHPHLSQLTEAQAKSEIEGSKQDLETIGVTSVTTFAYPYGDENSMIENVVKNAGFAGARVTQPGTDDTTSNIFLLKRQRVQANTSFDEVKAAIDQAAEKKKWIILVFHGIDDGGTEDVSVQMIQQIIDYVKQKNLPVVTTAEGLKVIDRIK